MKLSSTVCAASSEQRRTHRCNEHNDLCMLEWNRLLTSEMLKPKRPPQTGVSSERCSKR